MKTDSIEDALNGMNKDKASAVLDILFEAIEWYAKRPEEGIKARRVLKTLNEDYGYSLDYPACSHCEKSLTILRIRYDGTYICENARECYREMMEELICGVVVGTRMYQRNTIISFWDARDLPCSVEEYIQKEKPTIHARIQNTEMNVERYENELLIIEERLTSPSQ